MESKDWLVRAGTIWHSRAAGGREGISNSATWVEYMILPLGLRIARGSVATRMLITGKSTLTNVAVVPVSARSGSVPSGMVGIGSG